MRVALINARCSYSSVIPTGLLSIGTVLKEDGHEVKVYDRPMDDIKLIERIKKFDPDIIGVSFMTTEYKRARYIINLCRKNLKKKILCAGGYHVSALPELSLKNLDLDFVVIGEGEMTMKKICSLDIKNIDLKNITGIAYLDNDKFIQNPPRKFIDDLDSLPIIDRELLDGGMGWYLTLPGNIRGQLIERCTTIITSRGCPGNCIFCSSRAMWTSKVRQRSVKNVLDEIEVLVKEYKIKGLFFLDDTFTVYKEWVLEFCKEFRKKNIKITWGCSARINTINDEVLAAMKDAGCVQLDFGVESGSDRVLHFMHKGQNQKIIKRAFNLLHKHKLKNLACFIIGSPEETRVEMDMTFKLAKEIKPNFAIFSILTPLPGSPLYQLAIDNKWIPKEPNFGVDWSIRHSEHPVMGIDFTVEELLKIREKMEDHFFFRNYLHYFFPLLKKPFFILQLSWMVIKSPGKYIGYIFGKRTRRFSGFIESIYYDYKEWKAKRLN